jgi:hypothetical protein
LADSTAANRTVVPYRLFEKVVIIGVLAVFLKVLQVYIERPFYIYSCRLNNVDIGSVELEVRCHHLGSLLADRAP